MNMNIRIADESDIPALAEIYQKTVLAVAPQRYSPEQMQVWASLASDTNSFQQFILAATTLIAEDKTGILGFAGIAEDGHVTAVYVRSDRHSAGGYAIAFARELVLP